MSPTLADRASACLAELDRWRPALEPELAAADPPPSWEELRSELEALLPRMPDPGWRAPTMRAFSTSGAIYVAVFLVLERRGLGAEAVWAICDRATRARFERMRGLERMLASSGPFGWPMRFLVRSLEARSARSPVGGWVARYVPGGPGELGVDYHRCAIRELAIEVGASAFAPYICNADAVGSEVFGWGLVRTETLAQGGRRCDFRFRRGGPTAVVRHPRGG